MFTAISIVSLIADSIIGSLTDNIIDASGIVGNAFDKEKIKREFQVALVAAINRYATSGNRVSIAEPLLKKNSPLKNPEVIKEMSKILKFDREPDYSLIGYKWKELVDDPPKWRDFTVEAKLLVDFFKQELQASEIFRPVFDSKNLKEINLSIQMSSSELVSIEQQLTSLVNLMDSKVGTLVKKFQKCETPIFRNIYDFSWYIEEKTQDFVGRRYVFSAIDDFLANNQRGYFLI